MQTPENIQYKQAVESSEMPEFEEKAVKSSYRYYDDDRANFGQGQGQKQGFLSCDVQGKKQWRPEFIVSDGQDWVSRLTSDFGSQISIELEASRPSTALKESWAGSYTNNCFFATFKRGSWHDMNLAAADNSLRVSMMISAVKHVPVRPGAWFDSQYLKFLAHMDKWNPPFTNEKVFGKDGILPLMISGFVAGYKIRFQIYMSSNTYHRYVAEFMEAEDIRIGPFHTGNTYHKSADGRSFTIETGATYPSIIGFTVDTFGLHM